MLEWQVIKDKMSIILWPLSVALLIVAGWVGWTAYVRYQNAQALAMYERAVMQSQDQVIPALDQLAREYPDTKASRLAWLDMGHTYYQEGKIDLARSAYENSLRNLPEDQELRPIILLSLGYCFEMGGDYSAACRYFSMATESDRDRVKVVAYLSLGRVYKKLNDPAKAIHVYKKALSIKGIQRSYRAMAEWEMAQLTVPEVSSDK